MKKLIYVIFLFALFSCGSTKYIDVPVEVVKIQKEIEYRQLRDSIYLKDSVVVDRGRDTIRITEWHTEYHDRLQVDTLVVTDSISYPVYIKETEVVKEHFLYWWEKLLIGTGLITLLGIVLKVAFKKFI